MKQLTRFLCVLLAALTSRLIAQDPSWETGTALFDLLEYDDCKGLDQLEITEYALNRKAKAKRTQVTTVAFDTAGRPRLYDEKTYQKQAVVAQTISRWKYGPDGCFVSMLYLGDSVWSSEDRSPPVTCAAGRIQTITWSATPDRKEVETLSWNARGQLLERQVHVTDLRLQRETRKVHQVYTYLPDGTLASITFQAGVTHLRTTLAHAANQVVATTANVSDGIPTWKTEIMRDQVGLPATATSYYARRGKWIPSARVTYLPSRR